MNFSSFEYFIEVEKQRSFSKAADVLHVSQQALSSHISSIEKELGCQLFVRHIPLELTYAGELFLDYCNKFSNLSTEMTRVFQDISSERVGKLKIGITHTRGRAILPDIISKFQKLYPNYEVEIVETTSEFLVTRLKNHEIDLAIGYFKEQEDLQIELFYDEELLLLMPKQLFQNLVLKNLETQNMPAYQYTPSLLKECPMVLGSPDDMSGIMARKYLKANDLNPPIKARAENIETLLMLCVKGVGACFCPESLINTSLSSSEIDSLYIIDPDMHSQVSFATLKGGYQWDAINEFKKIAMMNISEIISLKSPIKRNNVLDVIPDVGII